MQTSFQRIRELNIDQRKVEHCRYIISRCKTAATYGGWNISLSQDGRYSCENLDKILLFRRVEVLKGLSGEIQQGVESGTVPIDRYSLKDIPLELLYNYF